MRFVHSTLAQRVHVDSGGAGAAVASELGSLGASRAMVLATTRERDRAGAIMADQPVAVWHDEVVRHVPREVAERARTVAADHRVDSLVSIGGGSTTGLAKAVALTTGLPIIAVPTTYAGSEATNIWGLTEHATKTTGVDDRVLPRAVVYDASLMLTLPAALIVSSGLNALAHGIDAMWGPRADPLDQVFAAEGIRALRAGLPEVVKDPRSISGHEQMLYGAYLAAVAFASAGSGLHHKVCHVLGGMFDLPHAETHAVMLPHVLAFNAPSGPDAGSRIATALDAPDAIEGLRRLYVLVDAPRTLRSLGMPEEGIRSAAEAVLAVVPAKNPAPVTLESLTGLLRAAWDGTDPR